MTHTLKQKLTEIVFTATGADISELELGWDVAGLRGFFTALEATGFGNYGDEFFRKTYVTSIGSWGLHKCDVGDAIRAALFEQWSGENYVVKERWKQALYRAKAITCLLLGCWDERHQYLDGMVDVVAWNILEYGTPDGPGGSFDLLYVGAGIENWRVYIEHESWP